MIIHSDGLEYLAKVDVTKCNRERIVRRLLETIEFAKETNRPDREEWCRVLLKKFVPQEEKK